MGTLSLGAKYCLGIVWFVTFVCFWIGIGIGFADAPDSPPGVNNYSQIINGGDAICIWLTIVGLAGCSCSCCVLFGG